MKFAIALGISAFLHVAAPAAETPDGVRVMSWNIRHGLGTDGRIDLERIADVVIAHDPDFVLLQEVDRGCARSENRDQAAEIGRLTGLHHTFGKATDHDGGEYGLAILSKFPMGETEIHRLPGDGEPRIVFSAAIDSPFGTLTVASAHLEPKQDRRQLAQSQVAAAALLDSPYPVILAGDFNARPDSRTIGVFMQAPWVLVPKEGSVETYPSLEPSSEIDHIILRGVCSASPAVVVPEIAASDHRPVVATVTPVK